MDVANKLIRRAQIGPYRVLAKIGEGGMGVVYLTRLEGPGGFNKLAVVKELRADRLDSPAFVEMFLNEARLAARLNHPNVVHTYGADEENGRLYLAMEYLDGQPWSRIRRVLWEYGALPYELHVKVIAAVLAGLHYAHELRDYDGSPLQIVHCDMSPQNVFVTYDGQVKLMDFGVARAVTSTEQQTGSDLIVGKMAYIAPEQARGEPVDRRADIFAVGVMLWEALAGRRFADDRDWKALRGRRAAGSEPRLREVVPDMPEELAMICDRAIALDPNDRFTTAAAFRDALLDCVGEDFQDSDRARLGALVSEAFQKQRARVYALIERHLKEPPANDDMLASLVVEPAEHTQRADLSELASVSRLRDDAAVAEASSSASVKRLERRPPVMIGAIAGGMLALALALFLFARSGPPAAGNPETSSSAATAPQPKVAAPERTPSSTHVATQAPPAKPEMASVKLSISASPAGAALFMDGVPLDSNPYTADVRADGEVHLIRATAPGRQSQERVITLDRERTLSFNLTPVRTVRAPARPAPRNPYVANTTSAAQPGVADPPPAARHGAAGDAFDAVIEVESKARKIYDEDPYQ